MRKVGPAGQHRNPAKAGRTTHNTSNTHIKLRCYLDYTELQTNLNACESVQEEDDTTWIITTSAVMEGRVRQMDNIAIIGIMTARTGTEDAHDLQHIRGGGQTHQETIAVREDMSTATASTQVVAIASATPSPPQRRPSLSPSPPVSSRRPISLSLSPC